MALKVAERTGCTDVLCQIYTGEHYIIEHITHSKFEINIGNTIFVHVAPDIVDRYLIWRALIKQDIYVILGSDKLTPEWEKDEFILTDGGIYFNGLSIPPYCAFKTTGCGWSSLNGKTIFRVAFVALSAAMCDGLIY